MTRSHRRFHKLFWLLLTPLLVMFFFSFQPVDKNVLQPLQQVPEGSSIAIFETAEISAEKP